MVQGSKVCSEVFSELRGVKCVVKGLGNKWCLVQTCFLGGLVAGAVAHLLKTYWYWNYSKLYKLYSSQLAEQFTTHSTLHSSLWGGGTPSEKPVMMWHYVWWDTGYDCVWWCDTKYDDVTLCMMMWHYVWWCDTMYDGVTLCMMRHWVWLCMMMRHYAQLSGAVEHLLT